jgi:hypothetical protein
LLFDVAALLITSAALGPAAEVSVAPASYSASAPLNPGASLPPITINGAGILVDPSAIAHGIPVTTFEISRVTVSEVRALSGIDLLRGVAQLPSGQLAKLVTTDPAIITKLLQSPPSSRDVASLWSSLSAKSRSSLITTTPRVVGGLDGFPVSVRNTANRLWVGKSIAKLREQLPSIAGRAVAQSDEHELDTLTTVETALKPTKHGPTRTLLSADPVGEGKAVIVLGNLQTASYVTYMVPGMFYTVDGQLGAWTGDAADLYAQQVAWLKRISAANPSAAHKTVAVVAWMGYHTPDLTNVGSLGPAYQARDALSHSIESLQLQRAGHLPYTTIVAHSYGSTAALMALAQGNFSVNALVLVGCPGSATQSAKDLDVKNTNVWVGAAAWDPVPTSAFFGSDPSAPSYGAHTMGVGGGTDVVTGKVLCQSIGHNDYFDPGTESIRNMAVIGIDQAGLVMRGDTADATRTLASVK